MRTVPGTEHASPPAPAGFAPRRVLLFSGHMMDAPGRVPPRFPPSMEAAATHRLGQMLDALGAGPPDLALSQAAAGGDLLFLEACMARGVSCAVLLPFPEPQFIAQSILPSAGGATWLERWRALKARLLEAPHIMPDELGPTPPGEDPYARCNRWLLDCALAWGDERLCFICLWNGAGGDGPGGTAHMVSAIEQRGGQVQWIDTRNLR